MLCHLMGTPFQPDLTGAILLIEERGEALYRIDRMLTHLKLAAVFSNLSGLVLGGFQGCGPVEDVNALVVETCEKFPFPILSGVTVGHGRDNITVTVGQTAKIDPKKEVLIFDPFQSRQK